MINSVSGAAYKIYKTSWYEDAPHLRNKSKLAWFPFSTCSTVLTHRRLSNGWPTFELQNVFFLLHHFALTVLWRTSWNFSHLQNVVLKLSSKQAKVLLRQDLTRKFNKMESPPVLFKNIPTFSHLVCLLLSIYKQCLKGKCVLSKCLPVP